MYLRQMRSPKPASDATDLHHVEHDVVGSLFVDGVAQVLRAPLVLAALDGHLGLPGNACVPFIIVR